MVNSPPLTQSPSLIMDWINPVALTKYRCETTEAAAGIRRINAPRGSLFDPAAVIRDEVLLCRHTWLKTPPTRGLLKLLNRLRGVLISIPLWLYRTGLRNYREQFISGGRDLWETVFGYLKEASRCWLAFKVPNRKLRIIAGNDSRGTTGNKVEISKQFLGSD